MSADDTRMLRAPDPAGMYQRLGELTRQLHDALQQLGYDKKIEASLGSVPDARSRLSFIAKVTGDAAEKVLNTVDTSQADQAALLAEADRMEALLKGDPVGAVARGEVLHFIEQVRENTHRTNAQLTDIMLAQDFHDLTGQTVRKVVEMATGLEHSLLLLLMEGQGAAMPVPVAVAEVPPGFLNGPVTDAEGRTDVVTDQAGVDALLDSLGF
ncbi:protein phosphatase CheZ [Ramlibacter sp. MAHUQ-53]|uniref:protein phosphatase CheZ n=1 Tax=unclassified Ramlibacter TaxID=2617605 RepID=UPI00363D300A